MARALALVPGCIRTVLPPFTPPFVALLFTHSEMPNVIIQILPFELSETQAQIAITYRFTVLRIPAPGLASPLGTTTLAYSSHLDPRFDRRITSKPPLRRDPTNQTTGNTDQSIRAGRRCRKALSDENRLLLIVQCPTTVVKMIGFSSGPRWA